MANTKQHQANIVTLSSDVLAAGFGFGLIAGALIGLFKAPASGNHLRNQISSGLSGTGLQFKKGIETLVPNDAVAESIAEGKVAAAQRRAELGIR